MKTAGILTIGNEILQGYTLDLNANTISKELTKRNINVTIHLKYIKLPFFSDRSNFNKFFLKKVINMVI